MKRQLNLNFFFGKKVTGVSWPCVHALSARWIPLVERSTFTATYNGAAVGGAINSVLSGLLITHLGWQHVFYLTGVLNLLWCFTWMFLVFDSPADHPRISSAEVTYLRDSVSPTKVVNSKKHVIPWGSILKSTPFWALLLSSQAVVWIAVTLSMQVPAYFSSVHHMTMTTNGLVSCLPELCKFVFGMLMSTAVDSMVKQKTLSTTAARKVAVTTSILFPGLLLVLLGYCSHNTTLAVAVLVLATAVNGASTSGTTPNSVDISPNYAGILIGLIKTVVVIPASLSPFVSSILVAGQDVVAGWQQLFCLTAGLGAVGCLIYLFLGSGDVQPWNDSPQEAASPKEEQELVLIKT